MVGRRFSSAARSDLPWTKRFPFGIGEQVTIQLPATNRWSVVVRDDDDILQPVEPQGLVDAQGQVVEWRYIAVRQGDAALVFAGRPPMPQGRKRLTLSWRGPTQSPLRHNVLDIERSAFEQGLDSRIGVQPSPYQDTMSAQRKISDCCHGYHYAV